MTSDLKTPDSSSKIEHFKFLDCTLVLHSVPLEVECEEAAIHCKYNSILTLKYNATVTWGEFEVLKLDEGDGKYPLTQRSADGPKRHMLIKKLTRCLLPAVSRRASNRNP